MPQIDMERTRRMFDMEPDNGSGDEDNEMALEQSFMRKYFQVLSHGIEELWLDQTFTDVVVRVGSKSYHCHRLILSAMSAYFSAMFRSGMRESLAGSVDLQNVDSDVFEAVLRFMYTGSNVISQDNVEGLLEAAVMLQIECLQNQCEVFLKGNIGPENCLGLWRLASNLGCSSLAQKSWTYILEFFPTVVQMEEFNQLTTDDLISIINDNDLNTSSEEAVCDAVIKWVEADLSSRKHELGRLFKYVRFPLIDLDFITDLRAMDLVRGSQEGQDILQNMSDFLTSSNPESDGHKSIEKMSKQFHHRQEEMMCVVGTRSRHPNPQETEIKCFSFRRDAEYTLASLPSEPGACFAVCKLRDDVYVSGGYHGQTLLLQFVAGENRWQHCSPMLEGRWGHSMVTVGGNIYVLGGSTRISETLSGIECYDPKLNECKMAGGLMIPVSFMPTATIGHKIYVFGGKMQDRTLSTQIQCFDTKKQMCFLRGEMPLVASTASRVTVVDETVYIFYRHGDIMEYTAGLNATVVGNMPHFDHFGVTPYQGQILIAGCQSNQYSTVLFNPVTREMTPFCRTVKTALCNFYCMPIVISKQHIRPEDKT